MDSNRTDRTRVCAAWRRCCVAVLMAVVATLPVAVAGESTQSLADQANNPNAPLRQFQLRDVVAPRLPETDGTGNLFQIEAVLPFKPFEFFPFPTLMKITLPYVTLPEPGGVSALGDIEVFDQAVFKEAWGAGPLAFRVMPARRPRKSARKHGKPVRRRRSCTPASKIWWWARCSRTCFHQFRIARQSQCAEPLRPR